MTTGKAIKFSFLIFFLGNSLTAHAFLNIWESKCQRLEWTKEEARSQGGGWVWYPGKGMGDNETQAQLAAEGAALEQIVKECQFPHKEIKVHERCQEELGGSHRVYLRMSMLESQCKEARYASATLKNQIYNKELMMAYQDYLKGQGRQQNAHEDCMSQGVKECYRLGKFEFFNGNKENSFNYFSKACQKEHIDSCFNAGLVMLALGNSDKAKGFLEMSCNAKDGQACFFLAGQLKQAGQTKRAEEVSHKACELSHAPACQQKYQLSGNGKQPDKIEYQQKACRSKDKEACHQLSEWYYDNKDSVKSAEFAKKACDFGLEKSCFNFAMLSQDKKNQREYLSKACTARIGEACQRMGSLAPVEQKMNWYKLGCDYGSKNACHEASVILFDSKKNHDALLFTKYACKLGLEKSCFNAGLLELKAGNKEDASKILHFSCEHGFEQSCGLLNKI